MSRVAAVLRRLLRVAAVGAEISVGARRRRWSGCSCPGLFVGLQAARRMEELAGTGSVARGALGLNGSPSERMCQAAMRILRATAALAGLPLPPQRELT